MPIKFLLLGEDVGFSWANFISMGAGIFPINASKS